MAAQIPLVDYLVLDAEPHLVAQECTNCCARFFGRRNACANCFSAEFTAVPIASEGTVRAFTIVAFEMSSPCSVSVPPLSTVTVPLTGSADKDWQTPPSHWSRSCQPF